MDKHILHNRVKYYARTTIGEIIINGEHFCYTLEDTVRAIGIKVKEETAIPESPQDGYRVALRYSNSKGKYRICLHTEDDNVTIKRHDVEFKYCDAHGGNDYGDTEGCVLVAYSRNGNTIQGTAEKELFDIVESWINDGYNVKWFINNLRQSN